MSVRPSLPAFPLSAADYAALDRRRPYCISPLLLADRMLTLAKQAEHAGLAETAGQLVSLAHTVLDERVRVMTSD